MDHLQWIMELQSRTVPRAVDAALGAGAKAEGAEEAASSRRNAAQFRSSRLMQAQALEAALERSIQSAAQTEGSALPGLGRQEEYEILAADRLTALLPQGQDMAAISRFFERDARRYG